VTKREETCEEIRLVVEIDYNASCTVNEC
jgi:hypothetical protein